ncbi:DUF1059 domain-containing protein [Sulfurisphaera javensis]|uniref:DUF1059 domain-containing protein n=1 Tax=Sulfurisphaera javensis TaxID=2049879 RepID=A0AAT9GMR7_9CREN
MVFGLGKKKKFEFSCSSLGMDCGFMVKNATSEEELLEILKIHAEKAHGIKEISTSLLENIKKNIKRV